MTVVLSDISNHNYKFFFQHQRVYTSTQQLWHRMGSLRHTFQLRLVAGRSHYRMCSLCLPGTYKLRPSDQPEPHCVHHIFLHPRMLLSARSSLQILCITLLDPLFLTIYHNLISLFNLRLNLISYCSVTFLLLHPLTRFTDLHTYERTIMYNFIFILFQDKDG
jgi:hypothetical protein